MVEGENDETMRQAAVALGNDMLDAGLICHSAQEHDFQVGATPFPLCCC